MHQFVRIGRLAMLGGCSKVTQDVPPFVLADGNPALARGLNSVGMQRKGVGEPARLALKEAYRRVYRRGLTTRQAVERIRAEVAACPEVDHLVGFIEASSRGIIRGAETDE
jgi:UDP-N-acetylglucosamine acyltransferase